MLAQGVGQLVLAAVGFAVYRLYRRPHLAVLAGSWLALAVHSAHGFFVTAPAASVRGVARALAAEPALLAGCVHIAWLLLAIQGIAHRRRLTRRGFVGATLIAAAAAVAIAVVMAATAADGRVVLGAGIATAYLLVAIQVLWGRRRGLGRWLVGGGFAVAALDLAAALGLVPMPAGGQPHLGYVVVLALMLVGLGMLIVLLEDERDRTTAAVEALQTNHLERLHSSKMEALGRMAGGVSHDFNNLLTAMRGHLELVLERTEPSDQRRQDLEQAWRAAERACHLTQQLLSFSRARPVAAKGSCDVVATLRELQPLLHRLVGQAIEICYDLPDHPLLVGLDRTGLEQVIINLGANSRDAMPAGGKLTVQIRTADEGTRRDPRPAVLLVVADTGCGMDEATRARIFDPFFTTKPPGFGTGLGLAQVYGIVQQAHGHIECSSAPGRGTAFTISLPLSDLPVDVPTPAPEPRAGVPAGGKVRDRVIMLVDDDALVRQFLCRSLRENGYTVIEAGDPVEALSFEAEFDEPIHLLITDLALPKLSGTELAARIRERRPAVRLLFISGYSGSHTPSPEIELLHKPFAQTAFLACVERTLAARPPAPASIG